MKPNTTFNWTFIQTSIFALGCFFLIGNRQAQAIHQIGGEISYEYIQQNQYRVNLVLYRDCYGINFANQATINISSVSCGLTAPNVTLLLDTFYDVSVNCEYLVNECDGGSVPGIQKYIYTGVVTLPQTCTDWILSYATCCRSNAITNIANPGSKGTYIDAMINSTWSNSSPQFTSRAVVYFFQNECYEYNHGGVDPDGDSLVYAMSCVRDYSNGTCIPYQTGYSAQQPFATNPANSFAFNTHTGQMSFCTSGTVSDHSALSVIIYEIKNGDTIGYVRREMQCLIFTPSTPMPSMTSEIDLNTLSGGTFDTTKQVFTILSNQTLNLDHVVYNPNGLPVEIDSFNTNLDMVVGAGNWSLVLDTMAPYRPDSVRANLQLNITAAQAGHRSFVISFTDTTCPVSTFRTLGYGLNILGINAFIPTSVQNDKSSEIFCPGLAQTFPINVDVRGRVGTYLWRQTSGPPVTFSDTTSASAIVNIPNTTQDGDSIVLELFFDDGIFVESDEITVFFVSKTFDLAIDASKLWLCSNTMNDTIQLSTKFLSDVDSINGIYTWTAIPASYNANLSSTTINNPIAIINANNNDSIEYRITYNEGLCAGTASVLLQTFVLDLNITASQDTICLGDTIDLRVTPMNMNAFVDTTLCSNYAVDSIPFNPVQGSGTNVVLTDNMVSGALPIGFDFKFYCHSYHQFYISSNGFITFDSSSQSGCCVGQTIPNSVEPNNLIALCWGDLNPSLGGTIDYFTTGIAPNRKLIVNYLNVPKNIGANTVTVQLVLHEGTNWIDIHTTNVGLFNARTQGIENSDGTIALATLGRNTSFWTATNDAYRYELVLPFTYNWLPNSTLSNNQIQNPQVYPNMTTTYQVSVEELGCVATDSIEVALYNVTPPTAPTLTCMPSANPTNTIELDWGTVAGAISWEYTLDGGMSWIGQSLQDSSLELTNLTENDCYAIGVRTLGGMAICSNSQPSYLTCCTAPLNDSITLNALTLSAVATGTNITYQWVDCDNGNAPIPGATGQTFSPSVNGNYAVVIHDGFNTLTSSCLNVNITKLNQLEEALGILCYPNPTTGLLQIEREGTDLLEIQVLDYLGRILLIQETNQRQLNLDLSAYSSGIYTIQFKNATKNISQKIIKQ